MNLTRVSVDAACRESSATAVTILPGMNPIQQTTPTAK